MPGLMAFHAHPDDEVISTGGVLSRYSAAGEQVVVITATDGAEGEIHNYDDPDSIKPTLADVRAKEIAAAMDILGVPHQEFLGFRDSGMMGDESNKHPDCFWQADFMDATGRLVRKVRKYQPDVMVIYDPFGGYGHPDHINVHRIGMSAFAGSADLARFPLEDGEESWTPSKLYWVAWPRSRSQFVARSRFDAGHIDETELERALQGGTPDEHIHAVIDVVDLIDVKLAALKAHRSQIPADWFLLTVPDEVRPVIMGRETFVRVFSHVAAAPKEDDLFAGLR
jgi:N-acetyl-1-D-myo-inositol-2-amino-2-deoxy-alpha-D-glucopyranoside deacetylase/mycothiol S-conjugate amidase